MKKLLNGLLLMILLSVVLTGCTNNSVRPVSNSGSIRICVDVNYLWNGTDENTVKGAMVYLLKTRMTSSASLKNLEAPKDIEVEYIPGSGAERENTIDRIRTEIMSGGGLDLFITVCDSKSPPHIEEALFPMPGKTMELGLFLTLDEYMENNTVFAEWDRMNSTVLDAGRTEEGQQIIPLCYTFPVSVYRAEDVSHTASKEMTWMDLLNNENEALSATAVQIKDFGVQEDGTPIRFYTPMTEFILGGIADYSEEELLFTEEELGQRLSEVVQLGMEYDNGIYNLEPAHYDTFAGYMFTTPIDCTPSALSGIDYQDAHTIIPVYSDDGGVTAEITAYTAINRNTERPEEVFRIMDYLVSYQAQRSDWLYTKVLYFDGVTASMPMYDELMTEDQRVYQELLTVDGSKTGWYMPEENFAQLCTIREQITNVKFRDVLDQEFQLLYQSYYETLRRGSDTSRIVSEGYRQLQRMIRE